MNASPMPLPVSVVQCLDGQPCAPFCGTCRGGGVDPQMEPCGCLFCTGLKAHMQCAKIRVCAVKYSELSGCVCAYCNSICGVARAQRRQTGYAWVNVRPRPAWCSHWGPLWLKVTGVPARGYLLRSGRFKGKQNKNGSFSGTQTDCAPSMGSALTS